MNARPQPAPASAPVAGELAELASQLGGHPARMSGHGDVVLLPLDVAAAIALRLQPKDGPAALAAVTS